MTIDTLKTSKKLQALGFNETQAEGIAEILSDIDAAAVTKEDLDALEQRLNQRMDDRAENVDRRFDELKHWVTQRFEATDQRIDDRFDALEQRFENRAAEVDRRFETLERRLDERFDAIDRRFVETEQRLRSDLRGDIEKVRSDMFKAIGGSIIAIGALVTLINYLMG